jgi:hypothetical protein
MQKTLELILKVLDSNPARWRSQANVLAHVHDLGHLVPRGDFQHVWDKAYKEGLLCGTSYFNAVGNDSWQRWRNRPPYEKLRDTILEMLFVRHPYPVRHQDIEYKLRRSREYNKADRRVSFTWVLWQMRADKLIEVFDTAYYRLALLPWIELSCQKT